MKEIKITLKELKELVDQYFFDGQPECSEQEDHINPPTPDFRTLGPLRRFRRPEKPEQKCDLEESGGGENI